MEQVIDEFMSRSWEEVEGHTLLEPREIRMGLHMEYHTLKRRKMHYGNKPM